jgi:hypothetical protein
MDNMTCFMIGLVSGITLAAVSKLIGEFREFKADKPQDNGS